MLINPVSILIVIVCKSRINPIDIGWFIKINNIDKISENFSKKISENSLLKILILEIKDKGISFSLKF